MLAIRKWHKSLGGRRWVKDEPGLFHAREAEKVNDVQSFRGDVFEYGMVV